MGIDGQTAKDYGANLEENPQSLLDRAKSGNRYKAPPVRRVYIPKGDGGIRSLGIPTFKELWGSRYNDRILPPRKSKFLSNKA
jgi:RNA-directed DNA polymerase